MCCSDLLKQNHRTGKNSVQLWKTTSHILASYKGRALPWILPGICHSLLPCYYNHFIFITLHLLDPTSFHPQCYCPYSTAPIRMFALFPFTVLQPQAKLGWKDISKQFIGGMKKTIKPTNQKVLEPGQWLTAPNYPLPDLSWNWWSWRSFPILLTLWVCLQSAPYSSPLMRLLLVYIRYNPGLEILFFERSSNDATQRLLLLF